MFWARIILVDLFNTMMVLEHVQLESLRYDVIQWLCVRNQTYSQVVFQLNIISYYI
jgi:hypothetical protein